MSSAHRTISEALSDSLASQCRLAINGFEVLHALSETELRRLRLTDLNRRVALSQPALSRLVVRLEEQGLVHRSDDPEDRRGVYVSLTDRGSQNFEEAMDVYTACLRTTFTDRMSSDEQQVLARALSRVAVTARRTPVPASPRGAGGERTG